MVIVASVEVRTWLMKFNRQRRVDQDLRRRTSFMVCIIGRVVPIPLAQQIEVDEAGRLSDVVAGVGERGDCVAVAGVPRQTRVRLGMGGRASRVRRRTTAQHAES